jgi:hypothetical protein
MAVVYRYNNYQGWIAAEQKTRPEKRKVAQANTGLYSAWGGFVLCRTGAFVEAITAFFRTHASTSLTAPLVLTGVRHTVSQVGLALGCVGSIAEMGITCLVFGKDAHKYRCLRNHLANHRANHDAYLDHILGLKGGTHKAKEARRDTPAYTEGAAALAPELAAIEDGPSTRPLDLKQPPHNMVALAKSYLEYEVGQVDLPEATNTFKRSLCMFLRDGPLQGGGVGCNLAMVWQTLKVSDLLQIVTVPINAVATAIGGAAFSIACGALHIVAGALARSEGLQKLAAATHAKGKIDEAVKTIDEMKKQRQASVAEALEVSAALLQHAARNEESAQTAARNQIHVGNWRIGYGSAAMLIGGASLTFFLVAGGLSTGGLLFAVAGGLALTGWLIYAARRNAKDAAKLQAAMATDKSEPPTMTLNKAIELAVDYLDRTGGIGKDNREGRRLIKHALIKIGMQNEHFWALRFCSSEPDEKGAVVDTLKVLIHNHVDRDGARRALTEPAAKQTASS